MESSGNAMADGIPSQAALRAGLLGYARHRAEPGTPGAWRYASGSGKPTLYSGTYAVLLRHLLDDPFQPAEAAAIVERLDRHQDAEGLWRDPVIWDQGWYAGDPLWCGRPHLACHALAAYAAIGNRPARRLTWLEPWLDPARLRSWLEARDWGTGIDFTGNEVMNVGTLLQYARDQLGDRRAAPAVELLLDWLAGHHHDPASGLWGHCDLA